MSGCQVVLRRDRVEEFLRDRLPARPGRPAAPAGLVLVSGNIGRRTLEERLADAGIPIDRVRITTIEDLARDLVERTRGSPPVVLDRPVRTRVVEAVIGGECDAAGPLGGFARRVPWESGEMVDLLTRELSEYHRCTDAGADHGALRAVTESVASGRPYAGEATLESLQVFAALSERVTDMIGETFVSRSHLVRDARRVTHAIPDIVGDLEWVALATVSTVDNPTLRFLAVIAETVPVHLFVGAGSVSSLETRLRSAALDVTITRGPRESPTTDAVTRDLVGAAVEHRPVTLGRDQGVSIAAVPDRRREVEFALRDARCRRRAGETTLVVARDAGNYRTPVEDVSLTADLPTYVESRRNLADLPAFRVVATTVELLTAAATPGRTDGNDDGAAPAVPPERILAPLQAGFCRPRRETEPQSGATGSDRGGITQGASDLSVTGTADGGVVPLLPSTLRTIAGSLRSSSPRPIADWRIRLPDDDTFAPVQSLLGWVDERVSTPPPDGPALDALVSALVSAHVRGLAAGASRSLDGVAVAPRRAEVPETGPAANAAFVRSSGAAGRTYDWLRSTLDRPVSWATAVAAVRLGLGTERYGRPDVDAGAIPVVDAGNAYVRRADHVYVLGLAADLFPRSPPRFTFIHRAVRAAVHRHAAAYPYLTLDSGPRRYEADLDAYEAALRAARDGITLIWPYTDPEGRTQPRSPFLDGVTVDESARTRVSVSDWTILTDDFAASALAPKERLRVLARYANATPGRPRPNVEVRDLAATVDPSVSTRILTGIDRFDSMTGAGNG